MQLGAGAGAPSCSSVASQLMCYFIHWLDALGRILVKIVGNIMLPKVKICVEHNFSDNSYTCICRMQQVQECGKYKKS